MRQEAHTLPSPWIVRPLWDLPLVILVPLIAVPLLWILRAGFDEQVVYASVMAFGALGHHLPGMMRAYGDQELFRRFRTRFLLAPIFLIAVCVGFRVSGLQGLAVVSFVWGTWHGLMQTYGFGRIYGAKRGSTDRLGARIDFALCLAWFGGCVVLSDNRSYQLFDFLSRSGVTAPSPAVLAALRNLAVVAMALTAVLYVARSMQMRRQGYAPSPIKHLLLITSVTFWWYTTNTVTSLIFGIALFEIFHDIQYLAIVWAYNRQRARGARTEVSAWTRFMFSGGFLGSGLYIGLVVGYGALAPLTEQLGEETMRNSLAGVLLASQLLHFYFDGFIWKVREAPTRASLGIAAGTTGTADTVARVIPGASVHLAKWLIFVVPVALLVAQELGGKEDEARRATALTRLYPENKEALFEEGRQRMLVQDFEGAVPLLRRAYESSPDNEHRRMSLLLASIQLMARRWAREDHAGAEALLKDTVHLESDMHLRLLEHADYATRTSQFREGLVFLELAGLIDGGFFRAGVGLLQAECLLRMNRPRDAMERVKLYKTGAAADPSIPALESRIMLALRRPQ